MLSTIRIGQGDAAGSAIVTAATPQLPAGIVSLYLGADAGGEAVLRLTPEEAALLAGELERAAWAVHRARAH